MVLLKLDEGRLSGIADAIRGKSGTEGTLTPAEMITTIGGIRNRKVKMGTITLTEDSQSLTVPVRGRLVNVIALDVPSAVGYVTQVMWTDSVTGRDAAYLAVAYRVSNASTNPVATTYSAISAAYPVAARQEPITFDTTRTDRLFAAGATYVWISYDWDDGEVEAVYDLSASENDQVKMVLISNGDDTYTAYLTGTGATKDFAEDEEKPWDTHIDSITAIVVGEGVTSVGAYMFRRHEAVQSLIFEDSSRITHLGDKAFQGCQFGGEFSFPGLLDAELAGAFTHCTKVRGLTLSENVKSLGYAALTSCMSLKNVSGLSGVESVGDLTFALTPKLASVDLDPAVCTSFGESAFHLSNALRYDKLSNWPNTETGQCAFPAVSFSEEMLEKIRQVRLPNVAPNTVNPDAQHKYTTIPFCITNEGKQGYIADSGCKAGCFYHIFNWVNGAPYDSIGQWWQREILDKYEPVNGKQIHEYDIEDVQDEMAKALGWTVRPGFPLFFDTSTADAAKQTIAAEIGAGRPMMAGIKYMEGMTYHAVTIIGSNAVTDKLIIADSVRTSGDRGSIYEMSFEQLFGDFEHAHVYSYDVKGG